MREEDRPPTGRRTGKGRVAASTGRSKTYRRVSGVPKCSLLVSRVGGLSVCP